MTELDEFKRRLEILKNTPLFAKPTAAESALNFAVVVLEKLNARLSKLEKGAGHGD